MRKPPKAMVEAIKVIEIFQRKIECGKRTFEYSSKEFAHLTYAARKAAADCGLKYTYGYLRTGNNWRFCRYLYFPGNSSVWLANGKDVGGYVLQNVKIVKVTKRKNKNAKPFMIEVIGTIKKVENVNKISAQMFGLSKDSNAETDEKDVTLSCASLNKFLDKYTKWLIRLGIIRQSDQDEYWGLHGYDLEDESLFWRKSDNVYCCPYQSEKLLDDYLPTYKVPGDGLLFTATIFSLLKPLFRICNLKYDVDFVLRLQLKNNLNGELAKEGQDALWLLELQTHMWCDYRFWPAYERRVDLPKFRNRYHEVPSLGFHDRCGFPILMFGYQWPDDKGEDDNELYDDDDEIDICELSPVSGKDNLSGKEISYLIGADCLPILVPFKPLQKNYYNKKMFDTFLGYFTPHSLFAASGLGDANREAKHPI